MASPLAEHKLQGVARSDELAPTWALT